MDVDAENEETEQRETKAMNGPKRLLGVGASLGRLAVLGVGLAGLSACAQLGFAPEADEPAVVARVGDHVITEAELEENLHGHLLRLELDHKKAIYRNQQQVLQYLIDSQLVTAEAEHRGLTPAELMQAEIADKAEEVSEEEIREVYDQFRDQLPGSYEEERDKIRDYLVNGKRDSLKTALVARLRDEAEIEVFLPYPDLPAIEVAGGASGPSRGAPDAPVTIVEFSDFQCPFCKRMRSTLDALMDAYPEEVRVVYRHFPLRSHEMAQPAAEASLCADEQGKFWAFHDEVFARQAELSAETLDDVAAEVGLDLEAYHDCVADRRYRERVLADYQAALDAGVQGSPAFFVNGRPIFGAESEGVFRELIERELARNGS